MKIRPSSAALETAEWQAGYAGGLEVIIPLTNMHLKKIAVRVLVPVARFLGR